MTVDSCRSDAPAGCCTLHDPCAMAAFACWAASLLRLQSELKTALAKKQEADTTQALLLGLRNDIPSEALHRLIMCFLVPLAGFRLSCSPPLAAVRMQTISSGSSDSQLREVGLSLLVHVRLQRELDEALAKKQKADESQQLPLSHTEGAACGGNCEGPLCGLRCCSLRLQSELESALASKHKADENEQLQLGRRHE